MRKIRTALHIHGEKRLFPFIPAVFEQCGGDSAGLFPIFRGIIGASHGIAECGGGKIVAVKKDVQKNGCAGSFRTPPYGRIVVHSDSPVLRPDNQSRFRMQIPPFIALVKGADLINPLPEILRHQHAALHQKLSGLGKKRLCHIVSGRFQTVEGILVVGLNQDRKRPVLSLMLQKIEKSPFGIRLDLPEHFMVAAPFGNGKDGQKGPVGVPVPQRSGVRAARGNKRVSDGTFRLLQRFGKS